VRDPTFWILARASGLTAYALITLSMLAGLVVKSRPFGRAVKAAPVVDVHRFLTILALGAVAIHATALVLDSTVHMSPVALLVPGIATYRPLWTGLGVVAADVAFLIWISFPLRKRIGTRVWRKLHWATYGVFVLATAHGLMAGTDASRPWVFDLYLGAVGTVAFATAWRAFARTPRPRSVAQPALEPERST
jgi:methionine sulfoxide reductase heme-binding subunit